MSAYFWMQLGESSSTGILGCWYTQLEVEVRFPWTLLRLWFSTVWSGRECSHVRRLRGLMRERVYHVVADRYDVLGHVGADRRPFGVCVLGQQRHLELVSGLSGVPMLGRAQCSSRSPLRASCWMTLPMLNPQADLRHRVGGTASCATRMVNRLAGDQQQVERCAPRRRPIDLEGRARGRGVYCRVAVDRSHHNSVRSFGIWRR